MYFCLLLSEAKWLSPSYLHFDCSRYRDRMRGGGSCAGENFLWIMLVELLLYVVAVVVDDVNVVVVVVVRVIFGFFVVCGVGIVVDVADIVQ